MYNITLIGTCHSEIGKCNSDELYKIIGTKKPILEVIFEERPSNHNPDTLEKKCIEKYKQNHNHNIEVVPVDIYLKPNYICVEFAKHDEEYRGIIEEQEDLIEQEGFDYLNSDKFFDLFEKRTNREKQLIDCNIFYKDML